MTINYTTLLGLAEPVTGTESGTWGDDVNKGITDYLDIAIAGTQTISGSQTSVTLSVTNGSSAGSNIAQAGSGATGSSQYQIINCTGNPAGLLTITAPASSKTYVIINATSTSQSVKIVGSGPTTGVTLVSGEKALVAWNGSDFVKISTTASVSSFSAGSTGFTPSSATTGAITLAGTLATTNGGTNLTSFTSGGAMYATSTSVLTTGTLPNTAGGTGQSSAFTQYGVTYASTTSALATTAAGTTTTVLHGNAAGAPTFGAVSLTADISGVLGAANGGTGVANNAASTLTISGNFATTLTISGAYNYTLPAASDTLVNLGSTQTLTNKTFTNPTVTNYTESVVAIGNSSTAQTLSLTSGTVQTVTLTGNCTFTMPTNTAGKSFILIVVQDATGSRTATFTSVKWPNGVAPTMTTTATTGRDIFTFVADGTNWYGSVAQAFA